MAEEDNSPTLVVYGYQSFKGELKQGTFYPNPDFETPKWASYALFGLLKELNYPLEEIDTIIKGLAGITKPLDHKFVSVLPQENGKRAVSFEFPLNSKKRSRAILLFTEKKKITAKIITPRYSGGPFDLEKKFTLPSYFSIETEGLSEKGEHFLAFRGPEKSLIIKRKGKEIEVRLTDSMDTDPKI